MSWLLGYVIGAILGGVIVVRILEALLGGLSSTVLNILRPIFFVGTVTTVATTSIMSRFTSKVRKLQRISASVGDRIDSIVDTERKRK